MLGLKLGEVAVTGLCDRAGMQLVLNGGECATESVSGEAAAGRCTWSITGPIEHDEPDDDGAGQWSIWQHTVIL